MSVTWVRREDISDLLLWLPVHLSLRWTRLLCRFACWQDAFLWRLAAAVSMWYSPLQTEFHTSKARFPAPAMHFHIAVREPARANLPNPDPRPQQNG